ncbi:agmatinase [candidate division KSB1 bacterium]
MHGRTGIFYQNIFSLNEADCAVVGLPWDSTVSGRPGARFGPRAIRDASLNIEDYSPYLDRDISGRKIHDAGDIELPFGDTETTIGIIEKTYIDLLENKIPVLTLGGEHLISWPVINIMSRIYGSDLFIIQIDAHADLRRDYLGNRFSHACVMNLVHELIGMENSAAIGIRSGTEDEWKTLRTQKHCFGDLFENRIEDFRNFASANLKNRKIYITLDVDGFDPSLVRGTGTPEPGGLDYDQFVYIIQSLKGMNIIGADIVELAPDYDNSGVSSIIAASAMRELLLLF